jgi:anti-sigma regulatory factor (Ser/Thr protein kinase)
VGPVTAAAAPTVEELGWFPVGSTGTAGVAKRAAVEAAARLGLAGPRIAELAIAVTEIGSNLHRHAEDGWISLRCLREPDAGAIEVVAVDSGPGMADVVASGRDGSSTGGTLGIGLGSIERLASRLDIYSQPGAGTVLAAQFWPAGHRPAGAAAQGLSRPMAGEKVCGDRFAVRTGEHATVLLVADGLGHGSLAAVAAAAAVEAFHTFTDDSPAKIIAHLHGRLSHTRGAAVSVARMEGSAVVFAGLGNVAGAIAWPDGERRGMVSMPGIVGHQARTVREFSYPLDAQAAVVLHSDGLTQRWSLRDHPGIGHHSPLVLAAVLLAEAGVRRDDACVAVARATPP